MEGRLTFYAAFDETSVHVHLRVNRLETVAPCLLPRKLHLRNSLSLYASARPYVSWNRGRAISIDSRSTYCFRCINLRNDCNRKKKKRKGKERNKLEKIKKMEKREEKWEYRYFFFFFKGPIESRVWLDTREKTLESLTTCPKKGTRSNASLDRYNHRTFPLLFNSDTIKKKNEWEEKKSLKRQHDSFKKGGVKKKKNDRNIHSKKILRYLIYI